MKISTRAMFSYVLLAWAPAAVLAVLLCRGWMGSGSIPAAIVGGVIALAVTVASGLALVRAARSSLARAASVFMISAMGRTIAAALLAIAAHLMLGIDLKPLLVGMMLCYLAALVAESVWLARAVAGQQIASIAPKGPPAGV